MVSLTRTHSSVPELQNESSNGLPGPHVSILERSLQLLTVTFCVLPVVMLMESEQLQQQASVISPVVLDVPVVGGDGQVVSLTHSSPRIRSVVNSAPGNVALVQAPGDTASHSVALRRPKHCVVATIPLTVHVAQQAPSPSTIGHVALPIGGHSVPFIHIPSLAIHVSQSHVTQPSGMQHAASVALAGHWAFAPAGATARQTANAKAKNTAKGRISLLIN